LRLWSKYLPLFRGKSFWRTNFGLSDKNTSCQRL